MVQISGEFAISEPDSKEKQFGVVPGFDTKSRVFEEVTIQSDHFGVKLSSKEVETYKLAGDITFDEKLIFEEESEEEFDWLADLQVRFKVPSVYEEVVKSICIRCQVKHLPLHVKEHKDIRSVISQVNPVNLILLPSRMEQETIQIIQEQYKGNSKVFCNEKVEVNLPTLKKRIHIEDRLWKKLAFQKTNEGGRIAFVKSQMEDNMLLPQQDNFLIGTTQTLLVSPPKLSQFKHTFSKESTEVTQFKNQKGKRVLHINDKATLCYDHKNNGIKLEGTVSAEFYKTRNALYKKCIVI